MRAANEATVMLATEKQGATNPRRALQENALTWS
jgi:hypothetical protein